MFFDWHDDPKAVNITDQMMFGPDYLVAPVFIYQATSRSVYLPSLPEGTVWQNMFSNVTHDTSAGSITIIQNFTLDTFPLYHKKARV